MTDIKDIQEFIEQIQEKFQTEYDIKEDVRVFATMTKVAEELGEVSNELLKKYQLQRKEKLEADHELGKEIADLVITIGSLAHVTGINLDKELEKRIEQMKQRHGL